MFRHPDAWIGYVPEQLPFSFSRSLFLSLNSLLDATLGALFLLNFFPKVVAAIAALHLLGILVTQPIDAVIIRDIGLLGASLSLLTWPNHYRRY